MPAFPSPPPLRRQVPPPAQTAPGVSSSAVTANPGDATSLSSAVLNTSASGVSHTAPNIVQSGAPTVTQTDPDAAPTSASPTTTSPSSGSSKQSISKTTLIGAIAACVIALFLLIVFAVYCNRRLKKPVPKKRSPTAAHRRNESGENRRRRSHLQPWAKFGEGGDTWEGKGESQAPAQQMRNLNVPPASKEVDAGGLGGMFKKTPSTRSGVDEKDFSTEGGHDAQPALGKYHPNLAEEMSTQQHDRHFLGRVEAGQPLSWDGETVGDESFLSLRNSGQRSSGADSPTLAVLRNTPAATAAPGHRWESAEIVSYDGSSTAEQNPFTSADEPPTERRRSGGNNPFFSAQDPAMARGRRSRSNSRSRPGSREPSASSARTARNNNPFTNGTAGAPPVPGTHAHHQMSASTAENAAAIQSLIAALDVEPERERPQAPARVSRQGSLWSHASALTDRTDLTYQDDVQAQQFPLPPSSFRR